MNQPHFFNVKGWKVLFQPMPSAQTINMRTLVHAGSAHEREPHLYGAAHFLEHMFFKGTSRYNYTEINRKFAKLGDVNAYTSLERTVFYLNSLPERIDEASELFFELFFDARMPEEEMEKERGVILEEYQSSEDNPISWGVKRINWDTWGDALHPVIGTRESISSLTVDHLIEFRKRFYRPENTLFVITGNLDPIEVEKRLHTLIPDGYENDAHKQSTQPDIHFKTAPYQLENSHSKQSLLFMVFPTVSEGESRKMRFLPDLAVNLLGGGMHSLLFESLRENLGLCYAVGMQYMTPCDRGYHSIYALLDAKNMQQAHDEALNQLHSLNENLSEDLFETAKSNLLFGKSRTMETASGRGAQTDTYFDNGESLVPFEEFREGIDSLSKEDVIRFVEEYLNRPKLAVVNADLPC